jgi:hypothetical protein
MDTDAATIQCLALFEGPQYLAQLIARAKAEGRALTVEECLRVVVVCRNGEDQFRKAVRQAHADADPPGEPS